MDEGYISIEFKTNIFDIYFEEEEDTDKFDEWLQDKLSKCGLFNYSLVLNPTEIPGVSKLDVAVTDFDYKHIINVSVKVDDGSHTFDEIYDNKDLIDYVDREVAPRLVDEFNNLLEDISFPMSHSGTDFMYMKFDGRDFYCLLGYSDQLGYFPLGSIRKTPFVVENDYEVFV